MTRAPDVRRCRIWQFLQKMFVPPGPAPIITMANQHRHKLPACCRLFSIVVCNSSTSHFPLATPHHPERGPLTTRRRRPHALLACNSRHAWSYSLQVTVLVCGFKNEVHSLTTNVKPSHTVMVTAISSGLLRGFLNPT